MTGLVFEKDLPHQNAAVAGVMRALDSITFLKSERPSSNPELALSASISLIKANLEQLARERDFQQAYQIDPNQPIFDISMETGTGKTFAYTKTMFELNKRTGISKFIVAVPRVAIKAGTVSFLKSEAAQNEFRDDFDKGIKVYEVQRVKSGKGKKERFPQAIADFCRADISMDKSRIHVLVVNAGMITSKTMSKIFDVALWDEYDQPFAGIAHTKPVLIVDEPHLFKRGNKTYKEMMRFKPQMVLRFGATFDDDLINMVNELTAVTAFNDNLVKGITAHVETFEDGKDVWLKLSSLSGAEASFELINQGKKTRHKLSKGESLEKVHPEMNGLTILSQNQKVVVLSNGLELKKGDRINPFSYSETLQEKMIRNAIRAHFNTERELYFAENRIKPLTLFFIDNIESYRGEDPALRHYFESYVESHIRELMQNETSDEFRAHLENAVSDISRIHGGYFSRDVGSKEKMDDEIEKQTQEILHDKLELLRLDNPRRFIFSKWTLREGWDNPNVFTICKLRSSGSDTSKLQEVGRGLRLPVNEHFAREKNRSFNLDYFVDFTEANFVDELIGEINAKSRTEFDMVKLSDQLIKKLLEAYPELGDEEQLLETLDDEGVINRKNEFKDRGYEKLKSMYPNAFRAGLRRGKVRRSDKSEKSVATIRPGKYSELRELWERLNQKVILEYKFENEDELVDFFKSYIADADKLGKFLSVGSMTETYKINVDDLRATKVDTVEETKITRLSLMSYTTFLHALSATVAIGVKGLHETFSEMKSENFDIDNHLSQSTIRFLKKGFNNYLLQNAFCRFQVGFRSTSNEIHPTKLTDWRGSPLSEIASGDIGIYSEQGVAVDSYLFDEIFYDGQLELENIGENIEEVVVFSKIPKSSIRIPLVGGGSYSPDFAYIVRTASGQEVLQLLVETKGKDTNELTDIEEKKIEHAARLFNNTKSGIDVKFETQFKTDKIKAIIQRALT